MTLPKVTLLLPALALAGCIASKEVPSTGPHPALAPAQVNFYQKPPYRYERLGTITLPVAANAKWDSQGEAAAAFQQLQAKAAALGANGVLFTEDADPDSRLATVGFNGTFYQVAVRRNPKTAVAQAIFVIKEKP